MASIDTKKRRCTYISALIHHHDALIRTTTSISMNPQISKCQIHRAPSTTRLTMGYECPARDDTTGHNVRQGTNNMQAKVYTTNWTRQRDSTGSGVCLSSKTWQNMAVLHSWTRIDAIQWQIYPAISNHLQENRTLQFLVARVTWLVPDNSPATYKLWIKGPEATI